MKKQISMIVLSLAVCMSACSMHDDCSKQGCSTWSLCSKKEGIQTPAYFAFDSDVLTMDDKENLDQVAKRLLSNPAEKVKICGFTDNIGSDSYNQELSVKRANSAADYLEWKGVAKDRITATGFGATRFADKNTTQEGRSKNRRVEVRFYK